MVYYLTKVIFSISERRLIEQKEKTTKDWLFSGLSGFMINTLQNYLSPQLLH